jgi:hypothetical protein
MDPVAVQGYEQAPGMGGQTGLGQPTAFQQVQDGTQLPGLCGTDGEAVIRVATSVVRPARSSNAQTGNVLWDNG